MLLSINRRIHSPFRFNLIAAVLQRPLSVFYHQKRNINLEVLLKAMCGAITSIYVLSRGGFCFRWPKTLANLNRCLLWIQQIMTHLNKPRTRQRSGVLSLIYNYKSQVDDTRPDFGSKLLRVMISFICVGETARYHQTIKMTVRSLT